MTDEEIKKLYVCYKSRLGAIMTKTIGSAMLQQNTVVASTFLPIPGEHHIAVVSGLAIGYAHMAKIISKATPPKLDCNGYNIGMVVLHIGLAMYTKDMLIKQGLFPEDIMKC